ncbi:class IIb bacteriocin, lactobin A/cerein 7B family [Limibacterium fermenti]
MNAQELEEVEGGIVPLVIAGIILIGLIASTQKAY